MYSIKLYSKVQRSLPIKQKVHKFLNNYLNEGTVELKVDRYDSCQYWIVVYDLQGDVIGFSAQEVNRNLSFQKSNFSFVHIHALFLSEKIRGRKLLHVLIQGQVAYKNLDQILINKKVYFSFRSRVPGAYAAFFAHYNNVFPNIIDSEKNISFHSVAKFIASRVYNENIDLDPNNFVLRNSYPNDSKFLSLDTKGKNKKRGNIGEYFNKNLQYDQNEAVFVIGQISHKMSLLFLFVYPMIKFYFLFLNLFPRITGSFRKKLTWSFPKN